jgi:putative transposase
MSRRTRKYPSDQNNKEWRVIKGLLPPQADNQQLSMRRIVDGIFYINSTGCQWRALPYEYPAWSSVNYHFNKWSEDGTLEKINTALCQMDRQRRGRQASPTGALLDSQSVKTSKEATEVGFDGGKRVKGHKRHVLTDTVGNMLNVVVSAANVSDTAGGKLVLTKIFDSFPTLKKIWADGGYKEGLVIWVKETLQAVLEIVKRDPDQKGFVVQTKRWVVERTLAWLNNYRRLSKDYERLLVNSEAMIYLASIRTMLKRVA